MKRYKVTFDLSGCISHVGADVAGVGIENVSEWVHSDTLFSAIIHAYAKKHGFDETENLMNAFPKKPTDEMEPPFSCSSMYLAKDDVLFVPKPKMPLSDYPDWSDFFKVTFISLDNLYLWLGIEAVEWTLQQCQAFKESIEADNEIYHSLFFQRIRAVNAKGRVYNQTQVFHRGETIYTDGTKGYFVLDVTEKFEPKLKDALNFLVDSAGVGGEINIGFSQVNGIEWDDAFSLKSAPNGTQSYLLSLFPIIQGIKWNKSWYDLVNRKSWFNSPFHGFQYKKKPVKMLAEGSCIHCDTSSGYLLDVTPAFWFDLKKQGKIKTNWHRIFRNGVGLFLYF